MDSTSEHSYLIVTVVCVCVSPALSYTLCINIPKQRHKDTINKTKQKKYKIKAIQCNNKIADSNLFTYL